MNWQFDGLWWLPRVVRLWPYEIIDVVRHFSLRAILIAILIAILWTAPAGAHALLVGTDPKDGSSLAAAPSTITLTFSEDIAMPAFIAVQSPDGKQVATSRPKAVDQRVTAMVTDVGKRGHYAVSYRVVSTDGHPVEGTIHYAVTSGQVVKQAASVAESTFVHRHSALLVWGILVAAVAIALLLVPLRRHHD